MAPLIFVIEIISHMSRVLSLTLRLFGNIFGEHLVVLIIASIMPFIAPLPIQFLGLIVGPLQAFIFLTLGAIYLTAATHVDDHGDEMGGVDGASPAPAGSLSRPSGNQVSRLVRNSAGLLARGLLA